MYLSAFPPLYWPVQWRGCTSYPCVEMSVKPSLCFCLSLCRSIHLSLHPSLDLTNYLSTLSSLSTFQSIDLLISVLICRFIHLSIDWLFHCCIGILPVPRCMAATTLPAAFDELAIARTSLAASCAFVLGLMPSTKMSSSEVTACNHISQASS